MARKDNTLTGEVMDAVQEAVAPLEQSAAASAVEHINFDQWWMIMSKKLKLKAHIKEILMADFKGRNVAKLGPKSMFDEAAKLFGYKW